MKSVFITFDQAFFERIMALLDRQGCRGFSYWQQVQGRGSKTGEPHYGSHAWPSMCSAIITIVDEAKVDPLLDALHRIDEETQQLGLRAFVWNIEKTIFSLSLQLLYGQHGKELSEIYLHLGIDYIGGIVTDVLPARFYGR